MLVVLVVAKTERQRARRALRDHERVIHQGECGGLRPVFMWCCLVVLAVGFGCVIERGAGGRRGRRRASCLCLCVSCVRGKCGGGGGGWLGRA